MTFNTGSDNSALQDLAVKGFATADASGGGVLTTFPGMTFSDVLFDGNRAGGFGRNGGGAAVSLGSITISNSTFANNKAFEGAGLSIGGATAATVQQSTFGPGNSAAAGGGILDGDTVLTLTNSTISGNTAGGRGRPL